MKKLINYKKSMPFVLMFLLVVVLVFSLTACGKGDYYYAEADCCPVEDHPILICIECGFLHCVCESGDGIYEDNRDGGYDENGCIDEDCVDDGCDEDCVGEDCDEYCECDEECFHVVYCKECSLYDCECGDECACVKYVCIEDEDGDKCDDKYEDECDDEDIKYEDCDGEYDDYEYKCDDEDIKYEDDYEYECEDNECDKIDDGAYDECGYQNNDDDYDDDDYDSDYDNDDDNDDDNGYDDSDDDNDYDNGCDDDGDDRGKEEEEKENDSPNYLNIRFQICVHLRFHTLEINGQSYQEDIVVLSGQKITLEIIGLEIWYFNIAWQIVAPSVYINGQRINTVAINSLPFSAIQFLFTFYAQTYENYILIKIA